MGCDWKGAHWAQVPMDKGDGIVDHPEQEPGHHMAANRVSLYLHFMSMTVVHKPLEVEQVYAVHFVDSLHVAVPALGHDFGVCWP